MLCTSFGSAVLAANNVLPVISIIEVKAYR